MQTSKLQLWSISVYTRVWGKLIYSY